MRRFVTSFVLTAMACAAAWHVARHETARLRSAAAVRVAPAAPARAALRPAPADPTDLRDFLERSRRDAEPHVRLTAEQWAALDALPGEALADWVRGMEPAKDKQLWEAALVRWGAFDAPAALAHAKALAAAHPPTGDCACCGVDPGGQFDHLAAEIHACWLRRDPAAALAAGDPVGRPERGFPEDHFPWETLAQTDFSRALDVLAKQELLKPNGLAGSVHVLIGNGLRNEPDCLATQLADPAREAEFARWLRNCRDEQLACAVFARVFGRARHEGAWLRPERMPPYMPGRHRLPGTLEDPASVLAMGALALGASPLEVLDKPYCIEDCAAAWAYHDPQSAGEWLAAQPSSRDLDTALIGFVKGLRRFDPEAAVRAVARITRPRTRLRECALCFRDWHLRQPAAAEAWLAAAEFTELQRLHILGQVGR